MHITNSCSLAKIASWESFTKIFSQHLYSSSGFCTPGTCPKILTLAPYVIYFYRRLVKNHKILGNYC